MTDASQKPDDRDDVSKSQVRRRMLTIARLHAQQYQGGWVPASNFLAAADDQGVAIASEAEAVAFLGDLLEWGLLAEAEPSDLGGVKPAFRHRRFKLTKKGRSLWMQEIEPVPGVDDDRYGD